jgi:hypothetical protein
LSLSLAVAVAITYDVLGHLVTWYAEGGLLA